jgi:carbon-monoxide dehydrogenase large subunit
VIARMAIDRDTGQPRIEHITWADDAGTVVHPQLAKGQLIGGLAQGLGQAMLERLVYDANGQLLSGSLMDYAVPRADDMPPVIDIHGIATPSPHNLLGAKGAGEAGCIGVPAALMNAARDALAPLGECDLQFPLTAEQLWRAMNP